MNIHYLCDHFPWFGEHQSYDQLPIYIKSDKLNIHITNTKYGFLQKCIGKLYSLYNGWWWRRDSVRSAAEFRFLLSIMNRKDIISHILFFEFHNYFVEKWRKAPRYIIGTIHHPPSQSSRFGLRLVENLKRLSSAVIMYQRDIKFFEQYIGQNRVKFIHHGVDTDFFYPAEQNFSASKKILFVGHNNRNTEMLHRIVIRLAKKYPGLQFGLVVPEEFRYFDGFQKLSNHSAVKWHQKISEYTFREFYQQGYLLLLPMNDSGANNAVVEALACGLPIVTTDVGGIRDYGGASIYPVVPNNDDNAMINLIERYLNDTAWYNEIAKKCREFAEQNLAWPIIAKKHLDAYKDLLA